NSNSAAMSNRGASSPMVTNHNAPQMAMNKNVPRPPQSGVRSFSGPSASASARSGGVMSSTSPSRSVPRPPAGSVSQPTLSAHNSVPSMSSAPRSYGSSNLGRSMPSVPRPSGRV